LGIALHQELLSENKEDDGLRLTGDVFISEIVPKSFGANTCLLTGMHVISINNTLAIEKHEAAEQLRNSTGNLTVLAQQPGGPPTAQAHYATATVPSALMRENRENPGIVFNQGGSNSTGRSTVIIDEIDPQGPFAHSKLRVGMQVVSINNFSCETPSIAHCMLTRASQDRMVTILAKQTCQAAAGTIVTATVVKATTDSKLGIMLGMNQDHVIVRYIREGGLLDGSRLEPGMILHRVNNTFIPKGMHNKKVSQLLSTLHGAITFLAEAPTASGDSPTPSELLQTIQTATLWIRGIPDQAFGLKLARSASNKRRTVVSHLEEGGMAAVAGLKIGMFLLAINDVPIFSSSQAPEEVAMSLIQQVREGTPVTLLVQDPPPVVPPVITGTVVKDTPSTKVGIRMRMHQNRVAIIGILEGSAAATLATDLLAGMLIQSVNNIDCSEQTAEYVANLLADLQEERITIVAVTPDCKVDVSNYVTAAVSTDKPQDADALFDYNDGKVYVSKVGVEGPFRGTAFRRGMEILTINNMECALLTPTGIQALFSESSSEESDRFVTLLAVRPPFQPGMRTQVLCKETPDTTLGMTFRTVNNNSKVIITNIADGSLASTTDLAPGMELMLVNNSPLQGLSIESAAKLLHDATGQVTLVVGDPSNASERRGLMTATLERPEGNDQPLGVSVQRDAHGKIVVTAIAADSLAAESGLEKGMELMSINNVDCQSLKALDVTALLTCTTGTVTLLAERPAVIRGDLVTAAMVKTTPMSKLGITVSQTNNSSKVLVKAIVPDMLCSTTDLNVGMWIKAINNQDVSNSNALTVAKLLGAQNSTVVVLAETTNETFDEEPQVAKEGGEAKEGEEEAEEEQKKEEAKEGESEDKNWENLEEEATEAKPSTEEANPLETVSISD
jgi:C-terminal processing protease CtpA/Prc